MSADRLDQLLSALPDSGLAPALVAWLVSGVEAWRQGNDLADALELYRPSLDQRDEWIQLAVSLCPGETAAAKIAFFLDCLDGHRQHPEETGQHLVEKLITEPVKARLSFKHYRRILDGRRSDGWREFGT